INVYVFFFNRGTAPREILNMQSTSKTFESTRQEALAADVRKAGELVASSSTPSNAPAPPVVRIPFALPPESVAARAPSPAPAPRPNTPIPFAPPPEDDGDGTDAQAGVEKKFAANDTLGAVLTREGFGSAGPNVIAALGK